MRFAFIALLVAFMVSLSAPAANAGGLLDRLFNNVTGCGEASPDSEASPDGEPDACDCSLGLCDCSLGLLDRVQELLSGLPSVGDCGVCDGAEPSSDCKSVCGLRLPSLRW